jgi:pimeloyl-ACP methyl ester carboxylesterase
MHPTLVQQTFKLAGSLDIAYDVIGPEAGPPVVLFHGFGQTRYAWGRSARALADKGYRAYTVDLRGHGESGWAGEGQYELDHYVDDARGVIAQVGRPAALVGASLGGVAALMACGEPPKVDAGCLVLVDITSRISDDGVNRIHDFMQGNMDGFDSLEEAADSVSRYLPNRARPKNLTGLMKNLRKAANGRLYWHWDPATMRTASWGDRDAADGRIEHAARAVDVPTLLLRGGNSELVPPQVARDFVKLLKKGELADIADAHHMVAGDQNDAFSEAMVEFVVRHTR